VNADKAAAAPNKAFEGRMLLRVENRTGGVEKDDDS
jgi:hypothetical protein